MFCKKCGKEIDNDCIFCPKCGAKQSISSPANSPNEDTVHEKQSSGIGTFFVISLVIILLVVCAIICVQYVQTNNSNSKSTTRNSQSSENKIFSRNAKNSDIYVDAEYSFPVSINLIVRPYTDIDGLELTIKYIDKSGETIKTQQKTIGNVKEGQEYRIQINLTDFSLSQIWNIDNCLFTVSNGTVKLLN